MALMASPNPLMSAVIPSGSTGSSISRERVAAYASAAGREGKMAQEVIEVGAVPSARGGRTA